MSKEYKVGDEVEVRTKPMYHQYQYDVGEVFTIYKITADYVYSDNIRCINKMKVIKVNRKNLIGGKLL